MSLIQDKIKKSKDIKQQIADEVSEEHITPTDTEKDYVSEIVKKISDRFAERLRSSTKEELRDEISAAIQAECASLDVPFRDQKRIEKIVMMTSLGWGPIEEYLADPDVTEIVVQRYDSIVIERNGKIEETGAKFYGENHLVNVINAMIQKSGRQINLMSPIADGSLEDGSRINAAIPPVAVNGATVTIRKFSDRALTGKDYLETGSLNKPMLYLLERCVRGKVNIIVSGGTGTGKTTLLNMLSTFIPRSEIIVTIEDTPELKLQQPNVRRFQVRGSVNDDMMNVDQQALVKASLRMRPDRIILGEIRDGTVVDLVSAASTGHDGTMCTVHANDPRNLCNVRIPILYAMNPNASFSEKAIAMQFAEAFQLIVQIRHFPDGSRKITQITQIDGTHNGIVQLHDIFIYNEASHAFETCGYVPEKVIHMIESKGLPFNRDILQ